MSRSILQTFQLQAIAIAISVFNTITVCRVICYLYSRIIYIYIFNLHKKIYETIMRNLLKNYLETLNERQNCKPRHRILLRCTRSKFPLYIHNADNSNFL